MHIIGIDVHKRKCSLCVQDETGKVLIEKTILTREDRLEAELEALVPGRVLVEASTTAQWVVGVLERLGFEVTFADPNFAPMYSTLDNKVKTDRRDARALADALRVGAFRKAHRLSAPMQRIREVLAARDMLVRNRAGLVVLVRAQIEKLGHRLPTCEVDVFWRRVREEIPDVLHPSVKPLLDALAGLEDQIDALDRQLAVFSESSTVRLLMTVPGVGPVTALSFISVVDDPGRFSGPHQLECYVGLVPSERSSGERRVRGAITKKGNSMLRRTLVQAAWATVRSKDPAAQPLQMWFAAVASRRGKQQAIVGLARRLTGILFAMWRDQKSFDGARTSNNKDRRKYRIAAA